MFYGVHNFFAVAFIAYFLKETRGKTQVEIDELYSSKKKNR